MEKDIIYGIQFKSLQCSYKQSCYFVSRIEALKVSFYLNTLEQNKKAGKIFMPFETSKRSIENKINIVENDKTFKSKFAIDRLKHKLGIKNYKIYNSAEDYIVTLKIRNNEETKEL